MHHKWKSDNFYYQIKLRNSLCEHPLPPKKRKWKKDDFSPLIVFRTPNEFWWDFTPLIRCQYLSDIRWTGTGNNCTQTNQVVMHFHKVSCLFNKHDNENHYKSVSLYIIITEIEECLHSRNGIKSKRAVSSASFFFHGLIGTQFSCWRQPSSAWPLKYRIFAGFLLSFERSYQEQLHLIICISLSSLASEWILIHCLMWFSISIIYTMD